MGCANGHGHWDGTLAPRGRGSLPREYAAWEEDPFTFAPEGGESGVSVLARALPVIRETVTRHRGERVLVVSHKATIRLVLSSLLGFDPRAIVTGSTRRPRASTCSTSAIAVRAQLMLFNDTSHYAHHPRPAGRNLSRWWDPAG